MQIVLRLVSLALIASVVACESSTGLSFWAQPSPAVHLLIERAGLTKVRRIELLVDVPAEGAQVFKVVYGDSVSTGDMCLGDCHYVFPTVIGMALQGDAGWLVEPPASGVGLFDVKPTHGYLASADFFSRFSRADKILFQQNFKGRLASDADTPVEGLRRIAIGLRSWISPGVAETLLGNPQVLASPELLEIIATLPAAQGDAYASVRSRARALLPSAP